MTQSQNLFTRAQKIIPGGVNSPVRAFKSVGGDPIYFTRGEGAYLIDADDKRYIDYVGSWGPLILGHSHPDVINTVIETAKRGLSFGACCELEVELAEKVCELMPEIDMVRMVNSGTEATMSAIRLARGFTGRDKFIKFEGCYHGHSDALLVKAGSGALTFGTPSSPGVPASFTEHTLVADFNNIDSVEALFAANPEDIAAIIIEPIAGNMNCVPGTHEFIQGLKSLCEKYGALLIFDEVMTGFRVGLGGATAYYRIKPDLVTLGKVIGGGMPVGAFGGRKDIMSALSPLGPVYQAGTLSGNPIAMQAGLSTLNLISQDGFFEDLTQKAQSLMTGLMAQAKQATIPMSYNSVGGMFGFFFLADDCQADQPITEYQEVLTCDQNRFNAFFKGMLDEGVYLAPSSFEAGFISSAHSSTDIEHTIDAAGKVLAKIAK